MTGFARPIGLGLVFTAVMLRPAAGQTNRACFDVSSGAWESMEPRQPSPMARLSPFQRGDSLGYHSVPPRIELREERFTARAFMAPDLMSEWYVLVVPEDALQSPQPHRFWRYRGDALLLHLGGLHFGINGELIRDGDGWRGHVREYTDEFPVVLYQQEVILSSVDCSAPPPIPASAEHALPRAVVLSGAAEIRLGEPLPEQVQTEQGQPAGVGRLGVVTDGPTGGRFAGATGVTVELGAGDVVRSIGLLFDDEPTLAALAGRLRADIGREGPSWFNRMTRITVQLRTRRVSLSDPRIPVWAPG